MFALKNLKVKNKGNFLYDCRFYDTQVGKDEPVLCTLLIGENGVGKSYLLSLIVDIFRFIESRIESPNTGSFRYDFFNVEYNVEGVSFSVIFENKEMKCAKEGVVIDRRYLDTPRKILGISFMVNDKFTFYSEDVERNYPDDLPELDIYKYLGIRTSSNLTYTSSIQKKVVSGLIKIALDQAKVSALKNILDFVALGQKVLVTSKINLKSMFRRKHDYAGIINKLTEDQRLKGKKYSYRISRMRENIDNIDDYLADIERFYNNESGVLSYCWDLNKTQPFEFLRYLNKLSILEDFGFVGLPQVSFYKNEVFDFNYTSSGEKHLVYTMVALIANITNGSLVLIDEPELSLHPRWQMKYVHLLKDIVSSFKGVHFILASHSHFIVSDLSSNDSSLVIMKKGNNENEERICEMVNYSTYAWSAENILYKVFGLRTTRNFYFEKDLSMLLGVISGRLKEEEIGSSVANLIENLERVVLDKNDPLVGVVQQARGYFNYD